jgi:TatD DNase family protein
VIVDSHCHLNSEDFAEDRAETIERALAAGVERMVLIDDVESAERHEVFYATLGVHPHEAAKSDAAVALRRVADGLKHSKVIAVGEIGLDYHYDFSPRDVQKAVFIEQLAMAREAGLPVVIHTREAWDDTFAILDEHWAPHGLPGIMHSFTGGVVEAQRSLELGFYLSFSGIVTFPKALDIQQAAREAPEDRILVETDAPYLAPVPKRGKRNEPAFVVHTAAKVAALRGVTLTEIAEATTRNFETLAGRGVCSTGLGNATLGNSHVQ